MTNNFVEVPRGAEAFASSSPIAQHIRVAQLLSMATQVFGSASQVAALSSEAAEIGTPFLGNGLRRDHHELDELPETQSELDEFTSRVLSSLPKSPERPVRGNQPQLDPRPVALWHEIDRGRTPASLAALANFIVHSGDGLDRVAAAAVLRAVPNRFYDASLRVLQSARDGYGQASELALAALGEDRPGDTAFTAPRATPNSSSAVAGPVSATVHGTWARLGKDRWYAPEGALHARIRRESTPSLFSGDDYFRWTSGYSEFARNQGALDLLGWLDLQGITELDTVFAHSHGGNVALSAAESGVRFKLLVLLHTPAIERTANAWRSIAANVGRVVVMRTRLDSVVLGDGLRTGSSQAFAQSDLPHHEIMPPALDRRAWMRHDTFVRDRNWDEWNLAREIRYERLLA